MRVLCRHGHFAFYPREAGDINRYARHYGQELVRDGDFYTFPRLQGAPKYSLQGKPYLTVPAVKTFEGEPWEVMKENGWVYLIAADIIVPKATIVGKAPLSETVFYFLAQNILVQPGSFLANGEKAMSYDGEFSQKTFQLRITGFDNE